MPLKSSGIIDWELDPSKLSENPILPVEHEATQKLTKEAQKKKILEEYFKIFRGCEFWIWDRKKHAEWYKWTDGQCCFNHMIGLPEKLGTPQPLYNYENVLFDMIWKATKSEKERFVWVKKATGLGITEFVLRMMAWLCLRNDDFERTEMCIVTGPNVQLARDLITRLKDLFGNPQNNLGRMISDFESAEDELILNKVAIKAFPSHHLNAMRGRPKISLVFVDEADFFPLGMQKQVRTVTERYIAKSHAIIIMVSTPNEPGGLFQNMEREIELGKQGLAPISLYSDLQINWEAGLDQPEKDIRGIFTREEIERQKLTPDFEREYNLSYGHGLGNILSEPQIKKSEELGIKLGSEIDLSFGIETLDFNVYSSKVMGIDPGFGGNDGSKFGITVVELLENVEVEDRHETIIRVLYSKEHEKIDYQEAVDICWKLVVKFDINRVYIDGSQNSVVRSLKHNFGEEMDYHSDKSDPANWHVYPISFAKESRVLLQKVIKFVNKEKVAVHPYFKNLLSELRTARHEQYALDKDKQSGVTYDEMDSFRMCLKHYSF